MPLFLLPAHDLTEQAARVRGRFCRHCGERPATRPRSLCYTCYANGDSGEQYPHLSTFGVGLGYRADPPLPGEPTSAEPGSPEKVAVMATRAERGEQLHHPCDLGIDRWPYRRHCSRAVA